MNKISSDLRGKGVMIYFDDILIYTKTMKEHVELVDEVIRRIGKNKFKIGEHKIQYCKNKIELLGISINGENQLPLERHKEKIEIPKDVKELQAFLGSVGWFRNFIPNYSATTTNLTSRTKKTKSFQWTEEMNEEFVNIKELGILNYKKDITLRTDASNIGLGAVLVQKDKTGTNMPVEN